MDLIADIILASGALAAAFYCHVLSRRLKRFTDLENGIGGAVAHLSKRVDDLNRTLRHAKDVANAAESSVQEQTKRAEATARQLELLIASMHDLDLPEPRKKEPARQ